MPAAAPQSVSLRKVEAADLATLCRFQQGPDACRMAAVHPRSTESFDAHWAKILADPAVVMRAIVADGVLAGHIACFKRDGRDFVGFWLGQEHWGRGIAGRALTLMLGEVTTRPLHARAAATNTASIRVLERCGFRLSRYDHSPADELFPACERALFTLACAGASDSPERLTTEAQRTSARSGPETAEHAEDAESS